MLEHHQACQKPTSWTTKKSEGHYFSFQGTCISLSARFTLLINNARWLDGSLGHISTAQKPSTELLQVSADGNLSEIIQNEIYKVTAIKAGLIQFKPADSYFDGFTIDNFRQELKDFHQALPSNVSIGILFDAQHASPLRANIFYLHLFYLSAMQLLHRRVISNPEQARMSLSATAAISEGQAAARVAARLLSLMRLEGAIVQLCWLCMFVTTPFLNMPLQTLTL